jgi:hypothetical protein
MRTARFVGALCFSRGKQRFSVAVQEVQAVAARQKTDYCYELACRSFRTTISLETEVSLRGLKQLSPKLLVQYGFCPIIFPCGSYSAAITTPPPWQLACPIPTCLLFFQTSCV